MHPSNVTKRHDEGRPEEEIDTEEEEEEGGTDEPVTEKTAENRGARHLLEPKARF